MASRRAQRRPAQDSGAVQQGNNETEAEQLIRAILAGLPAITPVRPRGVPRAESVWLKLQCSEDSLKGVYEGTWKEGKGCLPSVTVTPKLAGLERRRQRGGSGAGCSMAPTHKGRR